MNDSGTSNRNEARGVYRRGFTVLVASLVLFPMLTGFISCPPDIRILMDEYEEFLQTECGVSNLSFQEYWIGFSFWMSIDGPDTAAPNSRVPLGVSVMSSAKSTASVEWTPPPGATSFEFLSHQPVDPNGPTPFVFVGLGDGDTLQVAYLAPGLPDGRDEVELVDTFAATDAEGSRRFAAVNTLVTEDPGKLAQTVESGFSEWPVSAKLASEVPAWQWQLWLYPHPEGFTMTEGYCQAWLDVLQAPETFLAISFPLTEGLLSDSGSYALPVIFDHGNAPRADLLDYRGEGQTSIVESRLDLRPEYHSALANDGRTDVAWMAFSPPPTPELSCPQGLSIPEGEWELHGEMWFDFGGQLSVDARLEFYVCAEVQESRMLRALAPGGSLTVLETPSLFCLGPGFVHLDSENPPTPPFEISGPNVATAEGPAELQFHHRILSRSEAPIQVEIDMHSGQGFDWRVVAGTWEEPDPNEEITGPILLNSAYESADFWIIGEVPAGAIGSETIIVTIRMVDEPWKSLMTTDIVWLGLPEPEVGESPRLPEGRAAP